MHIETFEIAHRFRGPPRSGNGGYTCGRIAKHLAGPVTARLHAPPPLNAELRLETLDARAQLFHDTTLIGEAQCAALNLELPPAPSFADADQAARSFIGFKTHGFPGCFVCGPERVGTGGLRIFPGPLDSGAALAAPWTPDVSLGDASGKLEPEFLWSALDCTGAFTLFPLPEGLGIVLGELAVSIVGAVQVGEPCVVIGWPMGAAGRKRFAGTAIFAPEARLIAFARAVWIDVPLTSWN